MPVPTPVVDALNAQLGRELEAHVQYLSIAAHLDGEGLPELSRFFSAQAAEEHDHALRVLRFLQETGSPVAIPSVPAPHAGFESVAGAVALALESEEDVTRRIGELVDLAGRHGDHATAVFLQWFVTEQVEELKTMRELLAVTRRAGADSLLIEGYIARSTPEPLEG